MKRTYSTESSDLQPQKKVRKQWKAPPQDSIVEPQQKWDEYYSRLRDLVGDQSRAELLLRMVYIVASKDVISTWDKISDTPPQDSQISSDTSTAITIYTMVSRGQSRNFYDNILLRIGKYLMAWRISNRVEELRRERAPSKQPVARAGSTGEGNAVTRALNEFIYESKRETTPGLKEREFYKCKQWWTEGKVWMLLANAIDPAVLLFIPSGHTSWDDYRLWESE